MVCCLVNRLFEDYCMAFSYWFLLLDVWSPNVSKELFASSFKPNSSPSNELVNELFLGIWCLAPLCTSRGNGIVFMSAVSFWVVFYFEVETVWPMFSFSKSLLREAWSSGGLPSILMNLSSSCDDVCFSFFLGKFFLPPLFSPVGKSLFWVASCPIYILDFWSRGDLSSLISRSKEFFMAFRLELYWEYDSEFSVGIPP